MSRAGLTIRLTRLQPRAPIKLGMFNAVVDAYFLKMILTDVH